MFKKILSILGKITLIGTITINLVACNNVFTIEELTKLKEEKHIKTNDGILEWMAPQEKLFIKVGDNNRQLEKTDLGMGRDLYITNKSGIVKYVTHWTNDNGSYFKSVYRWDNDNKPNIDVENKLKIYLDL